MRPLHWTVVLAAILLSIAAWLYLFGASSSPAMAGMDMVPAEPVPWGAREAGALFVMWSVMMVAMMLPSALPVILLVARINSTRRERGQNAVPTAVFVLGYLMVWWIFSAIAAVVQVTLHSAALLNTAMRLENAQVGGSILIAAGIYQWLPLKQTCLTACRSPLSVIATEWREGIAGALRFGIRHGTFCVGCCWMLMALLFVAGVMNLTWVALIAAVVAIEKLAPRPQIVVKVAGLLLVAGGAALILR